MSMDFSRRQSLKVLAGAGLLSVTPIAWSYSQTSKQAFVFTAHGSKDNVFQRSLRESLAPIETSFIHIDRNNYESVLSIADISEGALLIGLVSEAEKVLIDAAVQDRRGNMQTLARVSSSISASSLNDLAKMTSEAAINKSSGEGVEKNQNTQMTNGSLISFYAYL